MNITQRVPSTIEDLSTALREAGWFAPHSFTLRNPQEENRSWATRSFYHSPEATWYSHAVQLSTGRPLAQQAFRKCLYESHYVTFDSKTQQPLCKWLDEHLEDALDEGYTQIESVRTDLLDILFLARCPYPRPGEHNVSAWQNEWKRDILDALPEPADPLQTPWQIFGQAKGEHPTLVHINRQTRANVYTVWNYPQLVHIAEAYVLYLRYRAMLEDADRYNLLDHDDGPYANLRTWTLDDLPLMGEYRCPGFLIRLIEAELRAEEIYAEWKHANKQRSTMGRSASPIQDGGSEQP